ncbi:MAG: hypothetical protein ACOYOV_10845 [Bacteroidales bacterium]
MATIPKEPSKFAWTEPDSAYAAEYPYNNATQTESGHLQEFDDTPGAERIRIEHRCGSFTEIGPDGTETHKIIGDGFEIVSRNKKVSVSGFCTVTIQGDSVLEVKGNCYQRVKGNFQQVVEGDYDLSVTGKTNFTCGGDMKLGTVNPTLGQVKLLAGNAFIIKSDLVVEGGISGKSLHSTGSVTAATGIHAGIPNTIPGSEFTGITTLGGINAGILPTTPTVPGVINASVMVTAPAVVGTVITFGAILMDPLGGAPGIRTMFDSHFHAVLSKDFGVTSVPTVPMPLP